MIPFPPPLLGCCYYHCFCFTHPPTHSLAHSPTHSLTHSLSHSLLRTTSAGIANTMDLPERLLPRVVSRLGLGRVVFKPYTRQQIVTILTARLQGLPGAFVASDNELIRCDVGCQMCASISRLTWPAAM